ncbi:hypothetical protein Tco_0601959 [Tanacetum coccineum]
MEAAAGIPMSSFKGLKGSTRLKGFDGTYVSGLSLIAAVYWESARDVYSRNIIIAIKKLVIIEWHNYKHWNGSLFLTNLNIEERLALGVSLRMFTRSIFIKRRVEDLQLRIKSYQKKLNLTKPDTYRSDLKRKTTYTTYSNPRGFIYQNHDKKNRLIRIDELHKFSDGTLNDVRSALDDTLKRIQMKFNTSAGNPVKENLLKLNLPDHRILKDEGEGKDKKDKRK